MPAFNEEGSIGAVAQSLARVGTVIVVDDASSDATAAQARDAGAVVVSLPENRGYGAAVEAGLQEAAVRGFHHALTADGDGQHSVDDVRDFATLLAVDGYELVIGIRPGAHNLVERMCGWYAQRALGVDDPLCGLKGYNLRFFAEYGGFDRRRSVGTELMTYAIRHGARWTQRPIHLRARENGGSRFYGTITSQLRILRSLWALVRVR